MSSTISKIEFNKINSFGQVSVKSSPSEYWLQQPGGVSQVEKDKEISKKNSDKTISPTILLSPEDARKTNNPKIIGASIASVTILSAAGIFFLLKGGPKGLPKQFQKLRNFFDKKVQAHKLEHKGKITWAGKMYLAMVKGTDNIMNKFEAINNFTSLKDLLFKKLMFNPLTGKYTGKVHDAITRMFEKLGRQSVVNTYRNTSASIASTRRLSETLSGNLMRGSTFDRIEINGVTRTRAQWVLEANRLSDEITESYNRNFSAAPLRARYYKVKKAAEELKAKFSNLRVFMSRGVFTEFLAENVMLSDKSVLQGAVKGYRRNISYSLVDLAKDSEDQIMKMTKLISFKDTSRINSLRALQNNMSEYFKNPSNTKLKQQVLKDIELFMNDISSAAENKTIDKKISDRLLERAGNLKDSFANYRQGKVEDVLDIYKKILPESEYKKLEEAYYKSVKSLDKSIRIETEDFVSKLRDLALGGAPTDVLTIIGPLGVLGYYLGKSEDNEQRMSISLKYGIPALAGIGVTAYCNAKLFAGSKSLIIGTISTFVLNQIGVFAEHLLKKSRQAKVAQTDNTKSDNFVKANSAEVDDKLKNPPKTV